MKCPAHKGAVCKVNSCGGCHVEWFDIDGNKVDNCSEGMKTLQCALFFVLNTTEVKTNLEKMFGFTYMYHHTKHI